MAEIRIPLDWLDGNRGIKVSTEEGAVELHLEPEADEAHHTWRSLSPDEAEALAAALKHMAKQARR